MARHKRDRCVRGWPGGSSRSCCRARCSARMRRRASRGYGDVAQVDLNLQEWDYGDYEGRTSTDIHKLVPDWSLWERRRAERRDHRPGDRAGTGGDSSRRRGCREMSRSLRTATCSACSRSAGRNCRRIPADASRSAPRPSASSAMSTRHASSCSGTSRLLWGRLQPAEGFSPPLEEPSAFEEGGLKVRSG